VELIPHPHITADALRHRADNARLRYPSAADEAWSGELWTAIDNQVSNRHYEFVQVFGGVSVYEYHHLIQSLPNACVSVPR
jgi:hypothetical protein